MQPVTGEARDRGRGTTLGHVALIVLACAVVYANTLHNGFHLDDLLRVQGNTGIHEFWPPWRHFLDPTTMSSWSQLTQYRPMLPLSLSINYAIAGDSLAGYHVGNILLQAAASVVGYFLVREFLDHWSGTPHGGELSPHAPALIALWFAVHPVSGVLVNYISGRDLLLMQLFMLASLLTYLRMRRLGDSASRWALCLTWFLLALLSKKNPTVLPALILLFELLFTRGSPRRLWRAAPFAAVVALLFLFISKGLGFSDMENVAAARSNLEYAEAQLQHHVFHYLRNFVYPFPIRQFPDDPLWAPLSLIGGACILGSWVLAWRWRRERPVLAFCLLAYQVLLIPTSSVLALHHEIVAYRPYPSSIFLFLGVGLLLCRSSRWGVVGPVLLAAYFAIASFLLNTVWKDGLSLYTHSVAYGGDSSAKYGLAQFQPDPGEKLRLLREVVAADSRHIQANLSLGIAMIESGDRKAGLEQVKRGVALDPNRAMSYHWLTEAYLKLGDTGEAATAAAKSASLNPQNLQFVYRAGVLASNTDRFEAAVGFMEEVRRRRPGFEKTAYFLGKAYRGLRRTEAAIQAYEEHLRGYPDHHQTWFNLGTAYMELQQFGRAVPALEQSLRFKPDLKVAHQALAVCHRRLGDEAAAQRHEALGKAK